MSAVVILAGGTDKVQGPETPVELWCRPSQAADGRRREVGAGPSGSAPLPSAHRRLPLSLELLLPGCGSGEGDAVGIQEIQQLPHGHMDALLLQLGLQLCQLKGLVQQDFAVEGWRGADVAPHCLLCGHCLDSCLRSTDPRVLLIFSCRLKGYSKLTGRTGKRPDNIL